MDIYLLITGMHGTKFICSLRRSDKGNLMWVTTDVSTYEQGIPNLPGRRQIQVERVGGILEYHYFDFKESDLEAFKGSES